MGVASVLLLAACAGEDEVRSSPASEHTQASQDPSPTLPRPGGETTYPDEGLRLSPQPSVARLDPAAVQTYVDFERAVRRTLIEAELDPEFDSLAGGRVVEQFELSVEYQQSNDIHYGGVIGIGVDVQESTANLAELSLCYDNSDAYLLVSGERRPVDGPSPAPGGAVLERSVSGWSVQRYFTPEGTC